MIFSLKGKLSFGCRLKPSAGARKYVSGSTFHLGRYLASLLLYLVEGVEGRLCERVRHYARLQVVKAHIGQDRAATQESGVRSQEDTCPAVR